MCKENCDKCLQDKSCCNGVFHSLVETCRNDCIYADECGCEGICQFYEVEE